MWRSLTTVFANIATVFTLNVSPKVLVSVIAFIEDLWFYQYHRRGQRYPSTVWFFVTEASFVGELKMSPDFIKVTNFLYEPQVAISKNQQMIDYL